MKWATGARGFTLTELLVVLAVAGIVTTVGAPTFISYWQAATIKAGAQELATVLNRGRQLAIGQNTTVCVSQSGSKVRFLTGGCTGAVWAGPGTDANGWLTLQNGVAVSAATANAVFTNLGAATTAGVYTVRAPSSRTMRVTVALSGRVTTGP